VIQQRIYDIIYIAPPQYEDLAARALALIDSSTLMAKEGLLIVQIHPKERVGVAAIEYQHFVLTDERRYGSTLLMFYRHQAEREVGDG
jgi:16S rRNA G966 N2-methylase RsmD